MRKILGLEAPIGRMHYTLVVLGFLILLMVVGEISLASGNVILFLLGLILGLLYLFTLVISSGNRLKDAGINTLFRWVAITPLFFLLVLFLMLVPTKHKADPA